MPQKFLHLNCFLTCGMTASNFATFWSIWFAVGGCTRAPKISASFVRTRRSSNAFASVQLFALTIAVYGPVSDATAETPYQKLACSRICCRGPTVSAGVRSATSCNNWSGHGEARSYPPACASFDPAVSMNTDALKRSVESGELKAGARYAFALSMRSANALRDACSAAVSLLSLLAWAVSQADPSTMTRATRSDAL